MTANSAAATVPLGTMIFRAGDEVVMRNVRSLAGEARFVVATRSEILNALAPARGEAAPPVVEPAEPSSPHGPNGIAEASAACASSCVS